jgi:hypothetical protein
MSEKQGDAQLKREGEKKKAKITMTWHDIECDESVKKKKKKAIRIQTENER